MPVENIAETVWAQKLINYMKGRTDQIEKVRNQMVAVKARFDSKGIDVTGTKLQGKLNSYQNFIDKISSEIVDSSEVTWLNNNYNETTKTKEIE